MPSVDLSVCLYCGKTADWIGCRLGGEWGQLRDGALDGDVNHQRGMGSFGGERGAFHCN